MKRLSKILAGSCFVWMLFITGIIFSQTNDTGTTCANFLKIGVDARALGMAGAAVGLKGNVMAVHWNPAVIGAISDVELGFMHNQYILDMSHEFAGFAVRMGPTFVLGISASYFNAGTLTKTERIAPGEFVETGDFNASDLAVYISMAQRIEDNFFIGLSVKPIFQTIGNYSSQTVGLDGGVLYFYKNVGVGFSVRNVGLGMAVKKNAYPLPIIISAGVSYKLASFITMTSELEKPMDNKINLKAGIEAQLLRLLYLRSGFTMGPMNDELGGNAGLALGMGFRIKNFRIDYAYNPKGFLGESHRISLCYALEKNRQPELVIFPQPEIFSPDGDGVDDVCVFNIKLKNYTRAGNWRLTIFDDKNQRIKVWNGKGNPPQKIAWKGENLDGKLIQAGQYRYSLQVNSASDDPPAKASGNVAVRLVRKIKSVHEQISVSDSAVSYQTKTFVVGDILFDLNSAVIREKYEFQLRQVVEFLKAHPEAKVIISGYTDDLASSAYNMQLGLARANSVMNYLIKAVKIDPGNIQTQSFGETRPLVPNTSPENRQKNRRVEILIFYKNNSGDQPSENDNRRSSLITTIEIKDLQKVIKLVQLAALKYDSYFQLNDSELKTMAKKDAKEAENKATAEAAKIGLQLIKKIVKNERSLYEIMTGITEIDQVDSWKRFYSAWNGKLVDFSELHSGQAIFILFKK